MLITKKKTKQRTKIFKLATSDQIQILKANESENPHKDSIVTLNQNRITKTWQRPGREEKQKHCQEQSKKYILIIL